MIHANVPAGADYFKVVGSGVMFLRTEYAESFVYYKGRWEPYTGEMQGFIPLSRDIARSLEYGTYSPNSQQ